MILVVSNTQDLTCDFVVRELRRRGSHFTRLNFDEFPRFASGVVAAGMGSVPRAKVRWSNRAKPLHLDEVRSALYRRPVPPVPDDSIQDQALRKFCIDECYDFLRGLLYSLDCHWISHPDAIRRAEHKVLQMRVASNAGLTLPRTIVTNIPEEVTEFFELCAGNVVAKCLYMGFIDTPGNPSMVYTSKISENDLADIDSVKLAPSIFQEYIDKDFDLRITIIGDRVFSVKIDATPPPATPDWRACDPRDLRHSPYALPAPIESACLSLVRQFNLDFGAIDLAVDKNGNVFFLEINPNGQWAWLEEALDLPISSAIVDRLEKKAQERRD